MNNIKLAQSLVNLATKLAAAKAVVWVFDENADGLSSISINEGTDPKSVLLLAEAKESAKLGDDAEGMGIYNKKFSKEKFNGKTVHVMSGKYGRNMEIYYYYCPGDPATAKAVAKEKSYGDDPEDKEINKRMEMIRKTKSPKTLEQYAEEFKDDGESLREIAENKYTPANVLAQLAKMAKNKEHFYIGMAVARNPNTPPDALVSLLNGDKIVRGLAISNPNLPTKTIIELSKSKNKDTLFYLTKNPKLPRAILKQLSKHKDKTVKEEAKYHLNPKTYFKD